MPGGNHDSFADAELRPDVDVLQGRRIDWVRALLLSEPAGGSAAGGGLEGLDLKFHKGYWGNDGAELRSAGGVAVVVDPSSDTSIACPTGRPGTHTAGGGGTSRGRAGAACASDFGGAQGGGICSKGRRAGRHDRDAGCPHRHRVQKPGAEWDAEFRGTHRASPDVASQSTRRGRFEVGGGSSDSFIVPGQEPDGGVPPVVEAAFGEALGEAVLEANFPHRSTKERDAITPCFLGGTSWNLVCKAFNDIVGVAAGGRSTTCD